MAYYVFDDAKNVFEGMTKEQIVNAIANATGLTPAEIDTTVATTAIKEQNAQRSVALWVGTQAEYNAIQQPDENTLYVVTDPNETNELQNQIDLLQAEVDRRGVLIWDGSAKWETDSHYYEDVAVGNYLDDVEAFEMPITNYNEIVVTLTDDRYPIGNVVSIVCAKADQVYGDAAAKFRGSFNHCGVTNTELFCVGLDVINGKTQIESAIMLIDPFTQQQTTRNLDIIKIRGVI